MRSGWIAKQQTSIRAYALSSLAFAANPSPGSPPCLHIQALRLPKPPPAVASLYTQKEFDAKRAYNVDKLQVKPSEEARPVPPYTCPAALLLL